MEAPCELSSQEPNVQEHDLLMRSKKKVRKVGEGYSGDMERVAKEEPWMVEEATQPVEAEGDFEGEEEEECEDESEEEGSDSDSDSKESSQKDPVADSITVTKIDEGLFNLRIDEKTIEKVLEELTHCQTSREEDWLCCYEAQAGVHVAGERKHRCYRLGK
ncbi:hypothetical protein PIB30_059010 [Stylosanthes scabra]|uniref:Uncharacterized protein n=1 Tax=Stylosanthes scabra TaxID=79078 RepID=A0ABU6ZIV5_9FABA|nr:hypothetical protein [Stylosanthes scabra]